MAAVHRGTCRRGERSTADLTSQRAAEAAAVWQPALLPLRLRIPPSPVTTAKRQQRASRRPVGRADWEGSQLELSEGCQGPTGEPDSRFCPAGCNNSTNTHSRRLPRHRQQRKSGLQPCRPRQSQVWGTLSSFEALKATSAYFSFH